MINTRIGERPAGAQDIESLMVRILHQSPGGLSDAMLEQALIQENITDAQLRIDALNSLLTQCRVQLLQKPDGQHVFKAVSEEHASRMKQLSYEESLVYEICQDAGSMGALATLFKNALKPMTQAKIN